MSKSQIQRNKEYLAQFVRPQVKLKKEEYEKNKQFIKSKGYSSFNEYINIVLNLDIVIDIVPCKTDALNQLACAVDDIK